MERIDINAEFNKIGLLLEKREFSTVIDICDSLEFEGYKTSEVLLVKLLAESKSKNMEELKNGVIPLETYPSYHSVISTAPSKTVSYVKRCNEITKSRSVIKDRSNTEEFVFRTEKNNTSSDVSKKQYKDRRIQLDKKEVKNKSWIWAVIGTIVIVIPILLVLGNNGFSITNVKDSMNNGGIKCLFVHNFDKAQCTSGRICLDCGVEVGKPKGHKWVEATCDSPKTCEACGDTEGEPLGHLIVSGKCNRCGEDLSELIAAGNQIREEINECLEKMMNAESWLEEGLGNLTFAFAYTSVTRNNFSDARFDLIEAKEISSHHPEFDNITKNLGYAHDSLEISRDDSITKYANCGMECMGYLELVANELNNLIGEE